MAVRRDPDEYAAEVTTFGRKEFIDGYWDYKAGQHVTILGSSGSGKTQFGFELLGATATPELQATMLVMKERDATVTKFAKRFTFKIIRSWPPPPVLPFQKKPPGYVLWPPGDPDENVESWRQATVFRKAIRDLYWKKGKSIIFADESYSLEEELKLTKTVNRVHTKGRGMDTGIWSASQRPAFISQWAYQANHLFLAFEPDRKARDRYGEISSGIDPALIRAVTERLGSYEFLYINREDRSMCIVGAS